METGESQYIVEQVLGELPRAKESTVLTWFRETHKWLKRHDENRRIFTAPEIQISEPFYGLSKILPGQARIELMEHTKDPDYKLDYDFLSLVIEKGLVPNREREHFVVLEDKGIFRWFWRGEFDYKWKRLSQNKVPVYAIFSITESLK